ncbi:cupredoxin domain-containing protein [Flindersiella endophytica]
MKLRDYGLAGGGLAFAAVALVWVSGAPAGAAGHHVDMENYAFSPRSLTVQRGDSVTWMNHDEAPHDAKTTSGPASFHSPMLNQGGSWTHTFNTAGTYFYYCTVHPDMKASIVVAAPKPPPEPEPTKSREPSRSAAPNPSRSEDKADPREEEPKQTRTSTATPSAKPTTTSPALTPTATSPAAASPAPTVIASVPQQGGGSALSPLLLLAGLVTAVAVFCLLALASRPSKEVREQTIS